MKTYLLSMLAAALVAALVGILAPDGAGDGIARHMRLLTSLFLVAVLVSPLREFTGMLLEMAQGDLSLPGIEESGKEELQTEMEEALENSSKQYFIQLLTEQLETEFAIPKGEIRCNVEWEKKAGVLSPRSVTVILSGSAIWKDPKKIRAFVSERLQCECKAAIE